MEENHMIKTAILRPRTFHVEVFSTRDTPARTL